MEFQKEGHIPKLNDSGIISKDINLKGVVYRKGDNFFVIIFDILGEMINVIETTEENISFDTSDFDDMTLAFVNVIFYDVFMIMDLLVVTKLTVPAKDHFTTSIKKDNDFFKKMFEKFNKLDKITKKLN